MNVGDMAKIIEFEGKKIVSIDYRQCKTQEELLQLLRHGVGLVDAYSDKEALVIIDVTGVYAGAEFMEEVKKYSKTVFSRKTKRGTIVGIKGIQKILLKGLNKLSVVKLMPFDTRERALEFLIK